MKGKKKPPPLHEADQENFKTLRRAALAGDLALVSVICKADRKPAAVICAVNRQAKRYEMIPLAVMLDEAGYELFENPGDEEEEHAED